MTTGHITFSRAGLGDVGTIAVMVGELLEEIMSASGTQAFNFNRAETDARLTEFISQDQYIVFIAQSEEAGAVGFVSLYKSLALYAEGYFGTIAECYVRPKYRSQSIGRGLLAQAKAYALNQGWRRLEVTTPPLPPFDRTLAFYGREGFSVAGGRKMKVLL
ncbi:GNAT family N-acetyltransferase [Methylovulum psychrotolerans]|nr:GNAT family N-acetyltransferase [Methylovulum psychrotolerans]